MELLFGIRKYQNQISIESNSTMENVYNYKQIIRYKRNIVYETQC